PYERPERDWLHMPSRPRLSILALESANCPRRPFVRRMGNAFLESPVARYAHGGLWLRHPKARRPSALPGTDPCSNSSTIFCRASSMGRLSDSTRAMESPWLIAALWRAGAVLVPSASESARSPSARRLATAFRSSRTLPDQW